MIDLDWLERLAKAATQGTWHWVNSDTDELRKPGEWRSSLRTIEEFPARSGWSLPKFIVEADEIYYENMDANADFIAAANPAAILALIAEVRALREYREMARKQVYELMGVIVDIEQFGSEFDDACMNTIKRVRDQLHGIAGTKPCG